MKRFFTTLILLNLLLSSVDLWSQQDWSWKKHLKAAESALQEKNYPQAAIHFESAWQKKSKIDLCFNAAEAFALSRHYEKAAFYYQQVLEDGTKDYPYLGIKYARALKQSEQYAEAQTAFKDFISSYEGAGKEVLQEIVQTEIAGCQLQATASNAEVIYLGGDLNTSANEIAPLPLSDDLLYYTADIGSSAKIYRSRRQGNLWSKGSTPENFPIIPGGQYGYGSLSPTGTSFYFSICEPSGNFQAGETRCEIFVTYRRGALWTQPQRLPDGINQSGITATQPYVVHDNDLELLYFVSNRNDGYGKLDLWVATRPIYPESVNFSPPQNLGPAINTIGDEIAPFYHQEEGKLYFSSNGQVGYGGFDIFSVAGSIGSWKQPINLGRPINSGADDAFLVKLPKGNNGFFASNRKFPREKDTTIDDDLFEVIFTEIPVFLDATAYDLTTSTPLKEMRVTVEEIQPNGAGILHDKNYNDGHYRLVVLPNRTYKVTITSPGYEPADYTFTTDVEGQTQYGKARFLVEEKMILPDPVVNNLETAKENIAEKNDEVVPPRPPVVNEGLVKEVVVEKTNEVVPPQPPVVIEEVVNEEVVKEEKISNPNLYNGRPVVEGYIPGQLYIARGTSRGDQLIYRSTSPRYKGVYYKIQVTALAQPNLDIPLFDSIRSLGLLTDEYLIDRNLSRVLLGDFFNLQEASSILQQVWLGGFPEAYLVKYENGSRFGRVNPN
jgi:tetratricopeptide (TPR) repeat protein